MAVKRKKRVSPPLGVAQFRLCTGTSSSILTEPRGGRGGKEKNP